MFSSVVAAVRLQECPPASDPADFSGCWQLNGDKEFYNAKAYLSAEQPASC
jgi:hypothetical protein